MLMYPALKQNDALGTANRGNPCESGLCTLCTADCKGKCETWLASLVGRKLLYPRNFGEVTAGSAHLVANGVGYHAVRIQGYAYGAHGRSAELPRDADARIFPNVDVATSFGRGAETRCRLPIMTGALGSTRIAARYWDSFAIGAALCGFPIVIGENVVGVDPDAVIEDGRTRAAPELDRRIETFLRYQMNVEDTRNGVAEYLIDKHGDQVILELKWGQGAKDIGGEIQVRSLEQALFLKRRGYLLDPDPEDPSVQRAFAQGAVGSFARHSRLGATDLGAAEQVRDDFMTEVARLRGLGFRRISLKTGAYGMEALAMAIRYAADAELDLLTIDGAGGGTGMSPWNMMDHWGVPGLPLHAKAAEYCDLLAARGLIPPPLSLAGGFAREDHIFKAMALGAPYTKLVCMGRAPMIPGFLGSNIEGVLRPERREAVGGHWDQLPAAVRNIGTTPETIFAGWESVRARVGDEEMARIPFGAVALAGYADKLACGLQQLMAGARKFSLDELARDDLMAANRETAEATGLAYMTEAQNERAMAVLA
ncbi:MAG: FMN-binding glutamate synthase family protein, partial [Alphaproteobacteria bacterium]|nr:FMN-binding glutamate synthase family protein [Alphaproteobacteria bacterium]